MLIYRSFQAKQFACSIILLVSHLLACTTLWALTFVVHENSDLVGKIRYVHPQIGETLAEVGQRYDLGLMEMHWANPKVPLDQILSSNMLLKLPSQFILPAVRKGIVVNLAQYRLYYFPPNDNIVITFPVGIGRAGWNTPLGVSKVIAKQKDPPWRPTQKVRQDAEANGFPVPEFFPPSPYNPLGKYVLRLGWPAILIHGSNKPDGIGQRVSAGCIRLIAADMEFLYTTVRVGTAVTIINKPVKLHQELTHPSDEVRRLA